MIVVVLSDLCFSSVETNMADSQIEIHDPFINNPERREDDEAASSSDTEDMEDTPEFRLLMAYAKRRRGNVESPGQNGNGAPPPSSPPISTQTTDDEKPKKKKKKKKIWKRFFRCIKPQTRDEEPDQAPDPEHNATNRCGFSGSESSSFHLHHLSVISSAAEDSFGLLIHFNYLDLKRKYLNIYNISLYFKYSHYSQIVHFIKYMWYRVKVPVLLLCLRYKFETHV